MSAGSGTLLGRDAEVATALEVLTGEGGGSVAVVGAAGIGKSALVREVSERAVVAGVTVRTTMGAASESDLPFVGLHDLIGEDLTADLDDLPPALRSALGVALLRTPALDGEADPLALNLGVLRVVERVSAQRRVLLVLDDVAWIDAATRATLAFVLRRVPVDRVSTLVAMRPDTELDDLAGAGTVRTIAIGPLDAVALAAAVEGRVGVTLPHRFAEHLHDLSGGNPLLALEIVRATRVDRDALAELAVPDRYRPVLMPRLDALSADARGALLGAALLSRPTLEELADVVLVDGVLEAEQAGVVDVEHGRVHFTHPLYAALCRDAATSSERRDMHALLAKVARDEVERARHLGSATLLPDEDVAATIETVADRAAGRAAIATAAELALVAEHLTPVADLGRRTARACWAAELFYETGDVPTAADVVQRLLDELEPGPLRAGCLASLARVVSEGSGAAARLLDEALAQPGLDPGLEGELRLASAGLLVNLGDLAGSRRAAAELEERAEQAGRVGLARKCRAHVAFVDLVCGTPPERSAAWRRTMAESAEYELSYDHPDLMSAWVAMSAEDNERALELIDGLMERARAVGNIGLWGAFAIHRGETALRGGDIAAACRSADQAGRILADGRHDEAWLSYAALSHAWRGDLEQARDEAAAALAMAERDGNRLFEITALHALGFVELSSGRPIDAAAHYERVARAVEAIGWRHPSLVVWQGNAVEAMVAAGRRRHAVAVVDTLAPMAARFGLATSAALVARCRALLLEDEGDLEGAVAALDESLALTEALDIPLEDARTLLVRGVVHRRRRQKARSRADLLRARDLFADRGAVAWTERAERELERSAAVATGAGLTSAERAVAELAADGATNREIASTLFLSEKTVEAVLTRVYRKLAVRSRTQLSRHPELAAAVEGRP